MALVKLDDLVVAKYEAVAEADKKPVADLLNAQLRRFSDIHPVQPIVILTRAQLQQLETLFGGGTLTSANDLLARAKSYASITLGKVALDLSPAQKQEITYRAQKQGKPPEAILREIIDQVTQDLFWAPTPVR